MLIEANADVYLLYRGTQGHEILGEELASFGKTITPAESAAAQLSVLKSLKAEQNGKFLSYEGDELPF